MTGQPTRELLAAIISRAVIDRRTAVTRGCVDALGRPIPGVRRGKRSDKYDITFCLDWFFNHGGLEICLRAGDLEVNAEAIKRRSKEPYEKEFK